MATLATSRPVGGISSFFNTAFGAITAWNDVRTTRKALLKLTSRELADIGLCHGDIEAVAKGEYC